MYRLQEWSYVHIVTCLGCVQRREKNLYVLAASQTRDKSVLTTEGVQRVLDDLRAQFDYIVCDSPAGK